jgi:hypothetical protein
MRIKLLLGHFVAIQYHHATLAGGGCCSHGYNLPE